MHFIACLGRSPSRRSRFRRSRRAVRSRQVLLGPAGKMVSHAASKEQKIFQVKEMDMIAVAIGVALLLYSQSAY